MNTSKQECNHEYISRPNHGSNLKNPECMNCGLLKSTIESGDTAPINNKAENALVISPDSLVNNKTATELSSLLEDFDEHWGETANSPAGYGVKDFIRRAFEAGKNDHLFTTVEKWNEQVKNQIKQATVKEILEMMFETTLPQVKGGLELMKSIKSKYGVEKLNDKDIK